LLLQKTAAGALLLAADGGRRFCSRVFSRARVYRVGSEKRLVKLVIFKKSDSIEIGRQALIHTIHTGFLI
jgi:hypothetical protein